MSSEITTPPPGVYRNIPFEHYLAWNAISNSRINLARRSLWHFKCDAGIEPTPSLRLGAFVHCGVLEPIAVAQRYCVMPAYELDPDNVTKAGEPSLSTGTEWYKRKVAEFERVNVGKERVKQAQYDQLVGINRAIYDHERARQYLVERGDFELAIVWEDAETGLLCKARLDFHAKSGTTDLKTTRDAQNFTKAIATYGYHRQLAHYRDGIAATMGGGELRESRIIAVETSPPYGVRAAPLSDDALDLGESEVRQTMRAIAAAVERDHWPCYEDPRAWVLPAWYDSIDQELELTVGGQTVSV